MRIKKTAILAIIGVALSVSIAAAQSEDSGDSWSGQLTIYGWIPGIKGDQTFPSGDPLIELSGKDVFDALDGAFFGAAEFRRGRWGLVFDFMYADLEQDGIAAGTIIPGAAPANATAATTLKVATAAFAYRAHEAEKQFVDVYGGLRYYDVDADFTFKIPSIGFETALGASSSWTDAIIGLRGQTQLSEKWSLTGLADVGGFGIASSSKLSWQALVTADYAFSERLTGRIGYRHMGIQNNSDNLDLDLDIGGPVIGLTWAF